MRTIQVASQVNKYFTIPRKTLFVGDVEFLYGKHIRVIGL